MTTIYGKHNCRHGCKGQGTMLGEPCECIHDKLLMGGSAAFQALADGEIEIAPCECCHD